MKLEQGSELYLRLYLLIQMSWRATHVLTHILFQKFCVTIFALGPNCMCIESVFCLGLSRIITVFGEHVGWCGIGYSGGMQEWWYQSGVTTPGGLQEVSESGAGWYVLVVESCAWDGITLFTCASWGLESSFKEVTLGVLMDRNWNMSQHCTLAVQKRISI